jgi:hypothetical protein
MKNLTFLSLLLLILIACEKDEHLIVENTVIPLLEKVVFGDVVYLEYTYNDANLLFEEKSKFHYTRHSYNDINQLVKSDFYWDISMASSDISVIEAAMKREEWVNPDNTPKSLTHSLEYNNNGQLIRKSYIRPSASNPEYNEFSYENDRISRQTMYWENRISGYIDYIYDERGNLIRETKYYVSAEGVTELLTTTEYEFDGMNNPFQAFKRLMRPGKYTNPNNILKETYTIHFNVDQWIEKVQITSNTYEYNDAGYPVRVNGEIEYIYRSR